MKFIPQAVSHRVAGQALRAQKHSPAILLGAGIAGMVGSTVLACRATLKLEEVLNEAERNVATAQEAKELHPEKYPDREYAEDMHKIKVRTFVDIGKLYVPSVLVGTVSIAALTKSHAILRDRNIALTAAYATVAEAFEAYRNRVREKYGDEADEQLRYETEAVKVLNESTGKKVSQIRVAPGDPSGYAMFFDEYSPNWDRDPLVNRAFLQSQQAYANHLLQARGYVFLNEVYESLGLDQTQPGQVVGWVIGDEGDNHIDFGIFNEKSEAVRDFVNGREGSILLDFNVDGVIWDKVPYAQRGTLAWTK